MNAPTDRARLKGALSKLDERDRQVFLMSAAEGLSHGEIAERLGISVAAVERHLAEALTQLARGMERRE